MGKDLTAKFTTNYKPVTFSSKKYTHSEVLAEALRYFKGDDLAADVWVNKYALKDSDGNIYEKSPDEMHLRIAHEVARIENKYSKLNDLSKKNALSFKEVYDVIKNFKYIVPQGSPMAGIGNNLQRGSLSNCFVIGPENGQEPSDSYGGILKIDQEQVQLMKRRGGVGHDLGHIRPKGSPVKNSALTSTGVVPFMERYSNSTREVAQEGRRGALMLSFPIKHPDAEDFIDAKMEPGKVTGANISIKIDDEFIDAVKNDTEYIQRYPIKTADISQESTLNIDEMERNKTYFTKDGSGVRAYKIIKARNLWDKIIHNAHASAEPGVLFWDTVSREAIPDRYADEGFETVSTNPCGEIPLNPYDSCRLLAINLFSYVINPFKEDAYFDSELFTKHAHIAQRIMDDIVDMEVEKIDAILDKIGLDPEPENIKYVEKNLWENIKDNTIKGRRIGIGITAEGDMLAALGLRYGSPEAIKFATDVHKTLALEVVESSVNLAEERGAFPIYDSKKEEGNPFIERIKEARPELYKRMTKVGRRNIASLTIAPTGSVSIETQTTSGIEPAFMVSYKRRRKVNPNDKGVSIAYVDNVGDSWEEYKVFHPKFEMWLKEKGYNVNEVKEFSDEKLRKIIEKSPYYKSTSADVDWVKKVEMQGAIQKWVDHSISVTVNVPEETTEETINEIYMKGWESGCKGMTVYREGSRGGVLIGNGGSGKNLERKVKFPNGRPEIVSADVLRFKNTNDNGGEDWIAFIGKTDEGEPFEIFTGKPEGAMLYLPEQINRGQIEKIPIENDKSRYDFIYENEVGAPNTIGGISHNFNPEYWNYARLVSGHLKEGTPIINIIKIVEKLHEENEGINTWKRGVLRALKKYIPDGTEKGICPDCNMQIIFEDGCERCGCGGKCG